MGYAHHTDSAVLAELGRRLARRRLDRNLTQAQLAERAGISPRTVVRLEAGESTQLTNLIRVLRALDLLDALDALIPPPLPSPIEQLRAKGRARKRASRRADKGAAPDRREWTWGDDAEGRS